VYLRNATHVMIHAVIDSGEHEGLPGQFDVTQGLLIQAEVQMGIAQAIASAGLG